MLAHLVAADWDHYITAAGRTSRPTRCELCVSACTWLWAPHGAAWMRRCPHMRTGQELLHDVAVVNLPAAGQPLLLGVQLLVVLNLKHTHKVILTPQQNNAKRFLGGLNRNEQDYRPNLSSIPWCRLIPHTRDTVDLLLRRTWAVARPHRSHSYRSPWTAGSL